MTQTEFHCPNCKRWTAVEIARQVAYHERRAFHCRFCGHCFTENQSRKEYDESVAMLDSLEAGDDEIAPAILRSLHEPCEDNPQ